MATRSRPFQSRRSPMHLVVKGGLAPGTAVLAAATARAMVRIGGLLRARIRIETSTGTGTLDARFVKPDFGENFVDDGSSLHTTGNGTQATVAAINTEVMMTLDDLYGEHYLELTYTDTTGGGGSVIKQITVSGL